MKEMGIRYSRYVMGFGMGTALISTVNYSPAKKFWIGVAILVLGVIIEYYFENLYKRNSRGHEK